jgi:hypothetical protein
VSCGCGAWSTAPVGDPQRVYAAAYDMNREGVSALCALHPRKTFRCMGGDVLQAAQRTVSVYACTFYFLMMTRCRKERGQGFEKTLSLYNKAQKVTFWPFSFLHRAGEGLRQ